MQSGAEWAGTAGLASVEAGRPMTLSQRLRVASITKMMTYAVIMDLVQRGRLALTDRAAARLPAGALTGIPHAEDITIEQLLDHSSGLHNFNGPNGADFIAALYSDDHGSRVWTAPELIDFARRPSNRPTGAPGERRAYSSTGYIILEMIAEHATRQPLAELYRRHIFDRLGLRETGFEGYDLDALDIGDAYARPADEVTAAPSPFHGRLPVRADGLVNLSAGLRHFNAWARGAGAVSSTACDLGRFMRAVLQGRLVVLRNQSSEFEAARARPRATLSWNGGSAGIQASIIYAPAIDATVIVLTNGTNVGVGSHEIAQQLLSSVREGERPPPSPSGCSRQGDPLQPAAAVGQVIRAYEQAFRTGDLSAMRRAFAPEGAYLTARPLDARQPLGRRRFEEAFSGWAGAPDPDAWVDVEEISFLGDRTALVRLRLHHGGRTYLDQLGLYRLGAHWRIVFKQSETVE